MATVENDRDQLLLATNPRNIAPPAGAALLLTADTPVFHVSTAGAGAPAAIHFKALPVSLEGEVQWSISAGGALTGTSNERTLAFASMTVQQITVTVTLLHISGVTFKAELVVNKVQDGTNGIPGSPGLSGKSARLAYTLIDGMSLNYNPLTVTVDGDVRPQVGTWGETRAWREAINAAPEAGQAWFQSNGSYDPVAGKTVWSTPYLSSLKVGALDALTTRTGKLTFSDTCQSANGNVQINADGTFRLRGSTDGVGLNMNNFSLNMVDENGVERIFIGLKP
ncbi:hypothetical protein CSQ90_26060 [Janthinobacterium sp. BJB303]|nr:hypothetical protein CSQ90_26060 [Janthinobacterium sp. BJB303]